MWLSWPFCASAGFATLPPVPSLCHSPLCSAHLFICVYPLFCLLDERIGMCGVLLGLYANRFPAPSRRLSFPSSLPSVLPSKLLLLSLPSSLPYFHPAFYTQGGHREPFLSSLSLHICIPISIFFEPRHSSYFAGFKFSSENDISFNAFFSENGGLSFSWNVCSLNYIRNCFILILGRSY